MKNKVTLELVGLNGNAYNLMGSFSHAASEQGWTEREIDEVLAECQSGDYDHLLSVLIDNTVASDEAG